MRKLAHSAALITALAGSSAMANTEATGFAQIEAGRAAPQEELTSWLKAGTAYRFNIFGGAKVNMQFVGAVGLGWDVTYSSHDIKNSTGKYQRYTWDWFALPISIGWLQVTPGLNWVVTDVDYPEADIREISIRPAGSLTLGLHVPVANFAAITLDARGEMAIADNERARDGKEVNITGNWVSTLAGVKFFF